MLLSSRREIKQKTIEGGDKLFHYFLSADKLNLFDDPMRYELISGRKIFLFEGEKKFKNIF